MKKYFTIHKNDAGSEAYTDQYVEALKKERDDLLEACQEAKRSSGFLRMNEHARRLVERALATIDRSDG